MEKHFDINKDGVSIRCIYYYGKQPRDVTDIVVAAYGFGGSKENKAVLKFAERLTAKYKHFGVVCFDWPAHGADARHKFTLHESLVYFGMVTDHAKKELGAARVYAYGTSFGGYVTLAYIAKNGNPFCKIALRCPAIRLYEIMASRITEEEWSHLGRGREITRGYTRKIGISQEFLDELKACDITKYEYFDWADDILILQGTKDEFVSFADVKKFADDNVIEMIPVVNADHPFSDPHIMDFAIAKIIDFFDPKVHAACDIE